MHLVTEAPPEPNAPPSRWTRSWPHLRAALVAAHIIAVVLLAIPDASGVALSRSAWKNPTVQAELEAWAQRLSSVGIQTDTATLEQDVYEAATTWTKGLASVRAPLRPYAQYLGVRQVWRMFVAPHRHPARLHVEVGAPGDWELVYAARSDEHDWRAEQFDHVRVRAMLFRYGWKRYDRSYRRLCRWVARQAAEDFPTASHVRVRMLGFRTPTPQEVDDGDLPKGEFRQEQVIPLERLR